MVCGVASRYEVHEIGRPRLIPGHPRLVAAPTAFEIPFLEIWLKAPVPESNLALQRVGSSPCIVGLCARRINGTPERLRIQSRPTDAMAASWRHRNEFYAYSYSPRAMARHTQTRMSLGMFGGMPACHLNFAGRMAHRPSAPDLILSSAQALFCHTVPLDFGSRFSVAGLRVMGFGCQTMAHGCAPLGKPSPPIGVAIHVQLCSGALFWVRPTTRQNRGVYALGQFRVSYPRELSMQGLWAHEVHDGAMGFRCLRWPACSGLSASCRADCAHRCEEAVRERDGSSASLCMLAHVPLRVVAGAHRSLRIVGEQRASVVDTTDRIMSSVGHSPVAYLFDGSVCRNSFSEVGERMGLSRFLVVASRVAGGVCWVTSLSCSPKCASSAPPPACMTCSAPMASMWGPSVSSIPPTRPSSWRGRRRMSAGASFDVPGILLRLRVAGRLLRLWHRLPGRVCLRRPAYRRRCVGALRVRPAHHVRGKGGRPSHPWGHVIQRGA